MQRHHQKWSALYRIRVAERLVLFSCGPPSGEGTRSTGKLKNKKQFSVQDDLEVPAPVTAEDVGIRISDLFADVMNGRRDPRIATTAAFVSQYLLKAMELSALEGRIEQLERSRTSAEPKEED